MSNLSTGNQKQSISDDQELAKALAGVTQEAEGIQVNSPVGPEPLGGMTPVAPAIPSPLPNMTIPMPPIVNPTPIAPPTDSGLASVKQAALTELRPLIDKLEVEPEEKFNTYLLLIRSTDDKELIAPAHEAAKAITDEAKKAQALLDIIKEIDFLSSPQKTA